MITQETKTWPEPTPEQLAYRALVASFKTEIKDNALSLRAEKKAIRDTQREYGPGAAASAQSRLSTHRLETRARLLIYGFLRGRTLEQMEPKRTKNSRLRYYVGQVWNKAQTANTAQTGVVVPMPELLAVVE